jgi:hypothetical protein
MFICFGLIFASCGGTSSAKSDISGVWKSDKADEIVKINLAGEDKTIEFGGQAYKAAVAEEEGDTIIINIEEEGQQKPVKITKVWSDNGSDFTLVFLLPDGTRHKLTPQG